MGPEEEREGGGSLRVGDARRSSSASPPGPVALNLAVLSLLPSRAPLGASLLLAPPTAPAWCYSTVVACVHGGRFSHMSFLKSTLSWCTILSTNVSCD